MLKIRERKKTFLLFSLPILLIIVGAIYYGSLSKDTYAFGDIYFPVLGGGSFRDDFNAGRASGPHHAIDIFNNKHTPLVAAVSGTITWAPSPQPSYGYMIQITDPEGYRYNYIHINNDNPGTDDGRGGEMFAYAPDMKVGNRVEKGQLVGWMGDSGNAETTAPHLHFEIEDPNGQKLNPYQMLLRAPRINTPSKYPPLTGELLPYWVEFNGGLNMTMAQLNNDTVPELLTAAGAGGGPHIKGYTNTNTPLGEFFAYDPNFRGGVDITAGDLTGDGVDEIITVPGPGGGPWVRIFNTQAALLGQFAAYDPGFKGGVRIAAGDVNGDGIDEIITAPGAGGGPWVRVFGSQGQLLSEFAAYDPGFKGGVDVASGDITGDTKKEIVTAPGAGGGPFVRVFNSQASVESQFFAYMPEFKGGVKVSASDVRKNRAKDEILTLPSEYGGPHVRLLAGDGTALAEPSYLEPWWRGYYDVAAGEGTSRLGTGTNRRAAIRVGPN